MSKEVLRTIINNTDCVSLYRKLNLSSRAVKDYTYYGSSGVVRRATCIYCRNVVATCSAKWKETKTFRKNACQHTSKCKMKWLSKQSNNS